MEILFASFGCYDILSTDKLSAPLVFMSILFQAIKKLDTFALIAFQSSTSPLCQSWWSLVFRASIFYSCGSFSPMIASLPLLFSFSSCSRQTSLISFWMTHFCSIDCLRTQFVRKHSFGTGNNQWRKFL